LTSGHSDAQGYVACVAIVCKWKCWSKFAVCVKEWLPMELQRPLFINLLPVCQTVKVVFQLTPVLPRYYR